MFKLYVFYVQLHVVLGMLQYPGLQFWGPQLVGVKNFYVLVIGL